MSNGTPVVTPTATTLVGSALVGAGAVLPWARAGTVTLAGIDSNLGVVALVLAGVTVGYTLIRDFDARLVGAVGVVCTAIAAYSIGDPVEPPAPAAAGAVSSTPSPAVGVFLSLVGGLVLLGAVAVDYRQREP